MPKNCNGFDCLDSRPEIFPEPESRKLKIFLKINLIKFIFNIRKPARLVPEISNATRLGRLSTRV